MGIASGVVAMYAILNAEWFIAIGCIIFVVTSFILAIDSRRLHEDEIEEELNEIFDFGNHNVILIDDEQFDIKFDEQGRKWICVKENTKND